MYKTRALLRNMTKIVTFAWFSVSIPYQSLFHPQERLAGVFVELGAEEAEAVPFHLLYQHPIIQDCMHMCQRFKAIVSNFYSFFLMEPPPKGGR